MTFHVVAMMYAGGGGSAALEAYERKAVAIMRDHGGKLLLAMRPPRDSDDTPDEIHVLAFDSRAAFDGYRNDERLTALRDERAVAIAQTVVYMSDERVEY